MKNGPGRNKNFVRSGSSLFKLTLKNEKAFGFEGFDILPGNFYFELRSAR